VRFCAASDQSLLVYLGDEISLAVHQRVVRLVRVLQQERLAWLRNLQPAYCSLLVTFEAAQVDHAKVEAAVRHCAGRAKKLRLPPPRRIEIPVCYGGEFGPDLDEVASLYGLTPKQVIALHSSQTYHAYFLGFVPGFAYLGDVRQEIATPRLATPRKKVPAGSVGMAGKQTAVYPFATPGGWRLLGRTPLHMFDPDRDPMGLISIGDEVRFRPIASSDFTLRASA
jgi:inhibitor of KinA